ncbi:MAG: GNAT family N-acetyltransferase [Bdellovibrionaceae bacterium]|nr:GNAT family N-acetyltransferase [Bdellovibrio sp.]
MKNKLPQGYVIKEISNLDAFAKLWMKPGKRFFNDRSLFFTNSDVYTKKELLTYKKLREHFGSDKHFRINLGLFYKNELAGWSWGFQENATVFYMCNSAILEKHRRKNLYTCLMDAMLNRAIEKGFKKIYSRHIITNNNILIAKLKHGFKITGFELSEAFGMMVVLTYFPQKIVNEILDFRSGLNRPNKKMKKIFKI